ncbi:MAG: hypothetical protein ICV54_01320 [Nostoc sp. C3-bin3]|nr:hypothetical protein [Nostoc sp. C3-bin3]
MGRDTHGSITYNLVLLTKNNSIPLRMSAPFSGVNGEEKEKREKSKKINSFLLNKEQTSLIIQQDDRLLIAILGGPHILFGSILIVTVLFWKLEISCLFDKSLGRMCLKSSNLLKQEKTREVMLHKIKKAVVVEETNKKGKKVSSLQLILSSGEEITLIQLGVRANNYEITQSINQFLGLTE